MERLDLGSKHLWFGGAGKKAGTSTRKTKPKTIKTYPATTGQLSAASSGPVPELISKRSSKTTSITDTKTTKTEYKRKKSRKDIFYEEINKYGMMALVGGTLINHAVNTTNKLIAASKGDAEGYKYYEERSKNYIKPHFSLPSSWHQSRVTFGTPWFY